MKDPKPSDFERRWLSAARAEEPPPHMVRKIERALGITGGARVLPAKRRLNALRIAGLSALAVGGAVVLLLLLSRPAAPTPVAERPMVSEQPPVAPTGSGRLEVVTPPPAPPAVESQKTAAPGPGTLHDEIALLDRARAALAAGSPAQARSMLERYRTRYPHGMLLPEALAMRIEAIDRSGDHARARTLALAFLAEYPKSPLAGRVAQLGR